MADQDDVDHEEQAHFQKIVSAFKGYRSAMQSKIKEKLDYIKTMSKDHRALLSEYQRHLKDQQVCIDHNAEIIKLILADVENMFENAQHNASDEKPVEYVSCADLDKIHSTFRQFVRDWSETGKKERDLCYTPIINAVKKLFPPSRHGAEVQILVPGAGLGRLAYELAKIGYSCQGNEFSLFMLFASNFVLNRCQEVNSLRIYPWVHTGSNVVHNEDQLKPELFPDDNGLEISEKSTFTMAAGDFLEIYSEDSTWDCIATCFFIDCAKNIIEVIETIYNILKPGGYWVNLGPLLYHFADHKEYDSIEPSWDIVRQIIKSCGFNFVEEPTFLKTLYAQAPHSLVKNEFQSIFFVVQKPSS